MTYFEDSGLRKEIIRAIELLGFEQPTPVQEQTIPFLLNDERDLVALAQTGTGKTAAFGLPLIQKIDLEVRTPQALILCPTRELCLQITRDLDSYAVFLGQLKVTAVYGGAAISVQIDQLKSGTHIVVATPGRALDLIRRKALKIEKISWLVLDEADEMLTMGFQEDLDQILSAANPERRTLLFSATMPQGIADITGKYLHEPEEISIGKKNSGAENVSHEYYVVHARDRYLALKRIADIHPSIYGIVFCRTRQETKEVADKLMGDGYNADALHGDLSQAQRDYVMKRFRNGNVRLLVATDVAARGLDVNNLTHVINYNLPDELEVYIHRSGRTGRAGRNGVAISILHTRETGKLKDLERMTGKSFTRKMIPKGEEICEKQLFNLIDRMEKTEVDEERIAPYLELIYKKLDWLNREELIKRFVSVEFNRFIEYYRHAPDLNADIRFSEPGKKAEKREKGGKEIRQDKNKATEFARFYINIGSKNNLDPLGMIGLIKDATRIKKIRIGNIDIMKKFSFFEIESGLAGMIPEAFKDGSWNGIRLIVQPSSPDQHRKDENFVYKKFPGQDQKKDKKRKKSNRTDVKYRQ
ncbi:MAG: DEAD/DEAH box helicase [Bacteroidota bacterium]